MGVRLHAHRVGDTLIVRLGGDLDLHTAPGFRRAVDEQLRNFPRTEAGRRQHGRRSLHRQLGAGRAVRALERASRPGRAPRGRGVRPRVRKLLELGGLLNLMDVEETESSALPKA